MAIRNISRLARVQEWWEYKLPPVLAIGYATALLNNKLFIEVSACLIFILVSVIVGATYVSTINDIADINEDLASGKHNRMVKIPKRYRWTVPLICIVSGSVFVYFYLPD